MIAVVAIAGLAWYFFAPRQGRTAQLAGGVQTIGVTVQGGYSPDIIHARQGVPLEIVFDRRESAECSNRVVFADLGVSAGLPAHSTTTVRLRPDRVGTVRFACGMNMIHGTLIVDPADTVDSAGEATAAAAPATAAPSLRYAASARQTPRLRTWRNGGRRSPIWAGGCSSGRC